MAEIVEKKLEENKMPKFVRIGDRVINLELISNASFIPSGDNQMAVLILYFGEKELKLREDEAEQLWGVLIRSTETVNLTPREEND